MERYITCSNGDGYTLTFGEKGLTPFLLADVDGVYEIANEVTISSNTMSDGGTYQGSVQRVRNIVLTLKDLTNHVYNRNLLSTLFKAGKEGSLIFHEDENERTIDYYVESVNSTGEKNARTYTVSLLCPDPFFYALDDVTVLMANWVKNFEFVHEFIASGEEFGYRSLQASQEIENLNAADNIGLTIVITANGAVTNPSVTRVESNESLTVGSSAKPFSMVSGDSLTITTSNNDKHVYLTHDGVTTEVNEYLTEDSVFIQLMRGKNNIGYDADSGVSNMVVSITYRLKYPSA